MPNRAEAFISIRLDRAARTPISRQLYIAIREAILNGSLPSGTRLPSSRRLASTLHVSRSTVSNVFDQLLADGYAGGVVGSGTYVSEYKVVGAREDANAPAAARHLKLSGRGRRVIETTVTFTNRARPLGAFRNGVPALDEFPARQWARHLGHAARYPSRELLDYGDAAGYEPLRRSIADRLSVTRAIRCSPRQIIMVEGTQHALDLIAQMLVNEGDSVCLEDPGYLGARGALHAVGAKLVPVPVDSEGFNVAAGIAREPRPRMILVCPSHQYPMGVVLSMRRRLELLAWAESTGAWVIEDDFENEFRYDGRPLESLHSLDRHDGVFYLGTFSKTLAPALRMGYVVVPNGLVDAFVAARRLAGRAAKMLEQVALANFIDDGGFARHVHRMRGLYAERQSVLLEELRCQLAGVVHATPAASGIHLLGKIPEDVPDTVLSARAAEAGIDAAPLSAHAIGAPPCSAVLLGYAIATPPEIRSGIQVIARCLDSIRQ